MTLRAPTTTEAAVLLGVPVLLSAIYFLGKRLGWWP